MNTSSIVVETSRTTTQKRFRRETYGKINFLCFENDTFGVAESEKSQLQVATAAARSSSENLRQAFCSPK